MSKSKPAVKHVVSGLERLGLRVSAMINHPIAQEQRWVTIHKLDSDGDMEWDEVMSLISETDGIEMTFNDDGSVTLRWEASSEDDPQVLEREEFTLMDEPAPF
ncbi:DUF1654 domain-containing protein [Pseudomonas glycinae]|uniref:DUF1654 domain-containing protein n=1 Tax=Pseudomonas glycinae TaxID=1785145 RepID=UPI0018D6B1D1|nr:DUF1654 domain-containing protein [Pseudomonas glycinae]MBH3405722.1 DUF1654 domain-containing protein [Pseudomonas glycinae]